MLEKNPSLMERKERTLTSHKIGARPRCYSAGCRLSSLGYSVSRKSRRKGRTIEGKGEKKYRKRNVDEKETKNK